MVFKYHIKEIILSFLLIFMLFVNIVLVYLSISLEETSPSSLHILFKITSTSEQIA